MLQRSRSKFQEENKSEQRATSLDLGMSVSVTNILREQHTHTLDSHIVMYENDITDFVIIDLIKDLPQAPKTYNKEQLKLITMGAQYDKEQLSATLLQVHIPFQIRRNVWMRFIPPLDYDFNANKFTSSCHSQIDRDLYRTHVDAVLGMDLTKYVCILRNILYAYSNYDPIIGYTQGMNIIAGMLILLLSLDGNDKNLTETDIYENEEEIFRAFVHVMTFQRTLFMDQTPGLYSRLLILQRMLTNQLPLLLPHLKSLGIIDIQMCFSQYYLTMLMQHVSKKFARVVFEQYLLWGEPFLQTLIVAMLRHYEKRILKMDDLAIVMPFLRETMLTLFFGEMRKRRKSGQLVKFFHEMGLFSPQTVQIIHQQPQQSAVKKMIKGWFTRQK